MPGLKEIIEGMDGTEEEEGPVTGSGADEQQHGLSLRMTDPR